MRWILMISIGLLLTILAPPCFGQVTGTPGLNDYTVNGSFSGSTSCNIVVIPPASPLTLAVSGDPLTTVIIIILVPVPGAGCPCTAGFAPFPPNCAGVQSLDILFGTPGCVSLLISGVTDAAGDYSVTAPSCPPSLRFSTQAVLLGPAACPPPVWTQAYDVSCL